MVENEASCPYAPHTENVELGTLLLYCFLLPQRHVSQSVGGVNSTYSMVWAVNKAEFQPSENRGKKI